MLWAGGTLEALVLARKCWGGKSETWAGAFIVLSVGRMGEVR